MIPPIQGFSAPDLAAFKPAASSSGGLGGAQAPASPDGQGGFLDTLKGAMNDAQQLNSDASKKVADLVNGNGADVHTAMIAVEKADLSFQMMMQVRNKIVS